jgi:hypothetical protein
LAVVFLELRLEPVGFFRVLLFAFLAVVVAGLDLVVLAAALAGAFLAGAFLAGLELGFAGSSAFSWSSVFGGPTRPQDFA